MRNAQLAPGSVFANRFEIDRMAGSGGMGTVYRARDLYSGATVALKLLQDGGSGIQEFERFAREAQILSELKHPGIVSYIANGHTPEGQHFLAMEWLDGEDLAQRLSGGPLLLEECTLLIEKVADALAVAHKRGIVHRDLKPTNLFLPERAVERVKILDFGIARRLMHGAPSLTSAGTILGTPEYMSPEQARGGRDLTPAADIFSLGCVLYECLTGQPPFVAEHIAAVLVRILFEEPVPISERRPGVPESLVAILYNCLHKDPAQRIADASALHACLKQMGESAEIGFAETLIAVAPIRSSFDQDEQSLYSVVLAGPIDDQDQTHPTYSKEALDGAERQSLLQALHGLGVSAEFLASGALVVTMPQLPSAADQATVAAHAALLIKHHWPEAAVSLATGRGTAQNQMAVGEVVEQAARLLQTGKAPSPSSPSSPGIFVDELSARLLEGRFALVPQPAGALLLSEGKEADATRPLLGKPTPCVGREAELAVLEAQLTACREESEARVMLVTAPAGTGKSRLRHEYLRRVAQRSDSVTVVLGRGDLMTAEAPYGILCQALRRLCGLTGSEPSDMQQARISTRIGRSIAPDERSRVCEFIGELCAVPFLDEEGRLSEARKDPRLMHDQIRRAFVKWLSAECDHSVVLLVLDDLQWGDSLSVGLMDAALHELRNTPFFVLALARPEVREVFPKLWTGHQLSQIQLKGLGRKACERLVQQVLGKGVPPEEISRIVEQSAGNALFLEELIRSAGEGAEAGRPDTVLAMLQARIGRFETGPRRAVRAASVFGQLFRRDGVAELLGVSGEDIQVAKWLTALVEAEVIEPHSESRIANEPEYGFRHALVRDAAYGLLKESDLKTGHRLAARYLERVGDTKPLVLAEHYRRGGEPERTVPLYLRIAEEASRMLAFPEARQHFRQAKAVLDELADSQENSRLKIDVLLRQVQLGLLSELPELNLALVSEARSLLTSLALDNDYGVSIADQRRSAWIDLLCGRIHYYQGRTGEAIEYYQRVLPLGEHLHDEPLLAIPSQLIGMAIAVQGHVGKSKPLLERAVGLQHHLDSDYERLRTLSMYGSVLVYSGQCSQGMALHEQVLKRAAESKQATGLGLARIIRADSFRQCGELQAWLEDAEIALAQVRSSGDLVYEFVALSHVGWAHSFLGRSTEALAYRGKAQEVARELGGRLIFEDWFAAADAEIALRTGHIEQALALAERLVPSFRTGRRIFALGLTEQVWGLALGQRSPSQTEQADAHLATALAVMEEAEQVMAAARLRLEWAQLCRRRGSFAQATDLRIKAAAEFERAGCAHVIAGLERACSAE